MLWGGVGGFLSSPFPGAAPTWRLLIKVRKKPVEVEAYQTVDDGTAYIISRDAPGWIHTALHKQPDETGAIYLKELPIEDWYRARLMALVENSRSPSGWFIHTLEGEHRVMPGDYIIKGVAGALYPCKPDIFDETYEVVE